MLFKEFAHRLYAVLKGDSTTANFTKTLFSTIVNDDGLEIVEVDYESSSNYRGFYNGNSKINKISSKIINYVDTKAFRDYIKGYGSVAQKSLCKEFIDVFPDATNRNIATKLSELFLVIISEAARTYTRGKKSQTSKNNKTTKKAIYPKKSTSPISSGLLSTASINNINKFYFREKEINDIKNRLLTKHKSLLALTAECGGIGKSTIAKEIYNDIDIQTYYSEVIWVDYVGNLDDSILNAIDIPAEITERSIRLSTVRKHLQSLTSQVLIIIDNVRSDCGSKQDPEQEQGKFTITNVSTLSPYINVLITTRLITIENYDMIRISRLSASKGTEMFLYHYNSLAESAAISETDIKFVHNIVKKSEGIPFIIMLLAKQAAITSIYELYNFLEDYFCVSSNRSTPIPIGELIKAVLSYKKVDEEERRILLCFATLPNIFITAAECNDWFCYDLNCVNRLANEGWLTLESPIDNRYRMHDLIKIAVMTDKTIGLIDRHLLLDENKYRFADYRISYKNHNNSEGKIPLELGIYTALINKIDSEDEQFMHNASDYSQITRLIETLTACSDYCILTNLQQAKIKHWIASFSFKHTKNTDYISKCYYCAISYLAEAIKCATSSSEEFNCNRLCMNYFYDYGYQLSSLDNTRYQESINAMSRAMAYCNRTYNRNSPKYTIDNEYSRVASYIERAIDEGAPNLINISFLQMVFLRKEQTLLDPEMVEYILHSYAMILDHWGYLLTVSNNGKFKKARCYLEIAYRIEQALYGLEPSKYERLIARTEDNLGYLLFHIDSAYNTEAERLLKLALNKRKSLMATDRYTYLSEYAWTVNNYAELLTCIGGERLDDAKKKYEQAIRLRKELNKFNNGKYIHYIAWSTYGLGRCLARQSNPDEKNKFSEALKYYQILAEDDAAYLYDCDRVKNVDIDIEDVFEPWIGNHAHFN